MRQEERNRLEAGLVCRAVSGAIEKHLKEMEKQIKEIEKWLKSQVMQNEQLSEQHRLITSIVGIGELTAYVWLGEFGYTNEFERAKQLESFCGLTPRKRESGTSVRGRGGLSKVGNSHIRKALFMPAMCAVKHNPVIKKFAERLAERGKPPKLILGAVMRKLVRIIFGVIKSGKPFDPGYLSGSPHLEPASAALPV
jgi:transposase